MASHASHVERRVRHGECESGNAENPGSRQRG